IIRKHAIKNALNPVVTAISGWFASMLAGAVFVEYIFGWNGLGKEIVNALHTLDLPVIMGSVLIIALLFIIINIFVDIIYAWLDPKVKLEQYSCKNRIFLQALRSTSVLFLKALMAL